MRETKDFMRAAQASTVGLMGKVVVVTIFYGLLLAVWSYFENSFTWELLEKSSDAIEHLKTPLATQEVHVSDSQTFDYEILTLLGVVFLLFTGWLPG